MKNVQELQRKGKSFPNAIVGHMAAETVISHNVITSGLLPKHMGWSNEVYRDEDNVLGAPGAYYVTSSMSCAQFKALIAHGGYRKIQDYLDSEFGESSRFASITPEADLGVHQRPDRAVRRHVTPTPRTSSSRSAAAARPAATDGRAGAQPEYANGTPPAYFGDLATACNRWRTWQGAGAYGTGRRSRRRTSIRSTATASCPGFTPAHVGGDTWSADAAIRVIQNDPTWHGMMVSLGGIDKMGHMWGPEDQGEAGRRTRVGRGDAPPAVRGEERRRPGGQDRRRPRREGASSTTPSS